jgi:predicted RNA-binding protein with PUA-like domain
MNYWLLKTEPSVYSYADLEKDKETIWDGVTSPGGLFQIRQIKKGDKAFIYHTGNEKQVTGIATVTSDPFIDPKAGNPKLFVFKLKPGQKLKNPVTFTRIKTDSRFRDSRLVKEGRLSVQPMPEELWNAILEMSVE